MNETPRTNLVQSLEMKEGCSTIKMVIKEDFFLLESKYGHLMRLWQKLTKNSFCPAALLSKLTKIVWPRCATAKIASFRRFQESSPMRESKNDVILVDVDEESAIEKEEETPKIKHKASTAAIAVETKQSSVIDLERAPLSKISAPWS